MLIYSILCLLSSNPGILYRAKSVLCYRWSRKAFLYLTILATLWSHILVFYTGFGLTFVISEPYLANCIAIQLHLIIDLVALKITFFLRQTRFFIAEFKYNIYT